MSADADPVNNMESVQIGSDLTSASKFLTNFKVYDGATLLSSSAADLTFNGSYYYSWLKVSGFSVPANTSKVLSVVADVKPDSPAGSVRLGIAGWNFYAPGAQVVPFGTPIYGSDMVITSAGTPSSSISSNSNFAITLAAIQAQLNAISEKVKSLPR